MGSGLILLEALKVLDEGGEFKDVRRAAEAAAGRCNLYFAVGTLEYLGKSGRIRRAPRPLGAALDVQPVLKLVDGEVLPPQPNRGRKRQMNPVLEEGGP